jgi:hypothetical protein
LQLYRTDNKKLDKRLEDILKEFFKFQISYINSKCLKYSLINMFDNLIYSKDNLVFFFADNEINTLIDFFKLSMNRNPLKTDQEIELYLKQHIIRINIDYFFLKEK